LARTGDDGRVLGVLDLGRSGDKQPGRPPARNIQAFGPARAVRLDVGSRCLAAGFSPQACCTERDAKSAERLSVDVEVVSLRDGDERPNATATSKRTRNGQSELALSVEHAPQQGAPGQRDCQQVDLAVERGQGVGRVGNHEESVLSASFAGRAPRHVAQSGGVGVYPNDEGFWRASRKSKDRRTVTRSQVDNDPSVPMGDLADVDVGELMTYHSAHDAAHHNACRFRATLVRR